MLRTFIATLAGLLLMIIIVVAGTTVATTLFLTETVAAAREFPARLPASYVAANLVISFLAAVAGGWLACRLDDAGRWRPVVGLSIVVLAMSAWTMRETRTQVGALTWYPWVILLVGLAGVALGGWSRRRSVDFPMTRDPGPM